MDEYTVGAVAKLSGVSVRLLHHYDRIGLLKPGGRSAAGYRIYSLADLRRLHRGLAELYVTDQRFGRNHGDMAPGLARYVHDAMLANASRAAS